MRRTISGFLIWTILLLGLMSVAYGKVYKWIDRQGRVHFTDNLSAIPPEHRGQVEERTSSPLSHPPGLGAPRHAPAPVPPVAVPHTSPRYTVPLHREGNTSLVDVMFNGILKVRMKVDTGAAWTVLPTSAAKQLALHLEDAPVTFIGGAVGSTTALVPLAQVKFITVGDATVQDVEVVVYDSPLISAKGQGQLGMTFLDEFQVTIDPIAGNMTLTPLTVISGETLHGGRPEVWWRRKFRYLCRQIKGLEAYLSQRQSAHMALGISNPSQSKLAKTLRYYQAELATLEHKTTLASVPRSWRYE